MLILLRFTTNKHHYFAIKCTFQENFLPKSDSMSYAYFPYQVSTLNLTSFNGKNIKTPQIWIEIIGKVPSIDLYGVLKDGKYQPAPTYNNCSLLRYVLTTV